jgi:hypothetical protein
MITRRQFMRAIAAAGTAASASGIRRRALADAIGNARVQIKGGALSATVSTEEPHGWCGLENLSVDGRPLAWQLSPALALEHYIGVPRDAPEYIQYEPCECHHELYQAEPSSCRLVYPPLPCSQVETRIDYELRAPWYVDVDISVVTQRADWPYGSLVLFFATIVKAPMYTGVYMLADDPGVSGKRTSPWLHFNGLGQIPGRTAHPGGVDAPELGRPANPPDNYYYDDSSVRFGDPLYYGCLGSVLYCLMFRRERRREVRFTVNPLAPAFGGPAWDFFWVIEAPKPGKEYALDLRVAMLQDAGPDDVLREYAQFTR